MTPQERTLIVQIVGQLCIIDGSLADAERSYLDELIARLGMGDAERKAALSGISIDSPFQERVAQLSDVAKAALRAELDVAAAADGALARAEADMVGRVRALLGG